MTSVTEKRENTNSTRRYYRPTKEGIRALGEGKALLGKTLEALESRSKEAPS